VARGILAGLVWGLVLSAVMVVVAGSLGGRQTLGAIPRAAGVDLPPGTEFDRARPDRRPTLPGTDPRIAEEAAPRPAPPAPDAASAPPDADTRPAGAPRLAAPGSDLDLPAQDRAEAEPPAGEAPVEVGGGVPAQPLADADAPPSVGAAAGAGASVPSPGAGTETDTEAEAGVAPGDTGPDIAAPAPPTIAAPGLTAPGLELPAPDLGGTAGGAGAGPPSGDAPVSLVAPSRPEGPSGDAGPAAADARPGAPPLAETSGPLRPADPGGTAPADAGQAAPDQPVAAAEEAGADLRTGAEAPGLSDLARGVPDGPARSGAGASPEPAAPIGAAPEEARAETRLAALPEPRGDTEPAPDAPAADGPAPEDLALVAPSAAALPPEAGDALPARGGAPAGLGPLAGAEPAPRQPGAPGPTSSPRAPAAGPADQGPAARPQRAEPGVPTIEAAPPAPEEVVQPAAAVVPLRPDAPGAPAAGPVPPAGMAALTRPAARGGAPEEPMGEALPALELSLPRAATPDLGAMPATPVAPDIERFALGPRRAADPLPARAEPPAVPAEAAPAPAAIRPDLPGRAPGAPDAPLLGPPPDSGGASGRFSRPAAPLSPLPPPASGPDYDEGAALDDDEAAPVQPPKGKTGDADAPAVPAGEDGEAAATVRILRPGRGESSRMPQIGRAHPADTGAAEAAEDTPPGAEQGTGATGALARNAAAFSNPARLPLLSIVIEDRGGPLVDLPFPVTIALPAEMEDAAARASAYRRAGLEVALIPALPEGATPADAEVALSASLSLVPQAAAVLAPQGAALTANRATASQVVAHLARSGHGLLTWRADATGLGQLAAGQGLATGSIYREVDAAGRNLRAVKRFLDDAAFRARLDRPVVVVAQNRPETIAALADWRTGTRADSVALAPLSAALQAGVR